MRTPADFDALLTYIKRSRGFDFAGYKHSGLMRRISKRMQMLSVERFSDYQDYLEVHPDEFALLFNAILINVTSFFRDTTTWEYIRDELIPTLLKAKKADEPVRVWSAGCASGEEAYTIAMLLADKMGNEAFKERVKIYASDIDEEALSQARQATYPTRDLTPLPASYLEKYFEDNKPFYTFRKDLRRSIIFGRHDLVQDAPISRVDLLICRNVLMYFNSETQARILSRFHFALNDIGYLFLGKAEMLFTYANLFTPVDLRRRVFTKVPQVTLRDRLMLMSQNGTEDTNDHIAKHIRFRESAFDTGPVAQLVVDLNGFVTLINERARSLLGLTQKDLNRALSDLDVNYRLPELRTRIEDVYAERRTAVLKSADWVTSSGDIRSLEVQVAPLISINGSSTVLGVSVTFTDMTRNKRLQEELEHANQELETAYEELQSSNEELETTNEELQSTIEELETTNEELQSTNEELETINEELQSTNVELQTVNEELRHRTEELNQSNGHLESILGSLRGGVVVLDPDLYVQVWNYRAEDLWGLRSAEARGKNFLNLEIGLPTNPLRPAIRACLSKESEYQELNLDAINRRGKSIHCKVTCSPLLNPGPGGHVKGVIIVMEDVTVPPAASP